jgi:hypothetical protein
MKANGTSFSLSHSHSERGSSGIFVGMSALAEIESAADQ